MPSTRALLASIFLGPDVDGRDPEAPDVVDAVCAWHEAVYAADAEGTLGELLRARDLLGVDAAVRWARRAWSSGAE